MSRERHVGGRNITFKTSCSFWNYFVFPLICLFFTWVWPVNDGLLLDGEISDPILGSVVSLNGTRGEDKICYIPPKSYPHSSVSRYAFIKNKKKKKNRIQPPLGKRVGKVEGLGGEKKQKKSNGTGRWRRRLKKTNQY
eukprot:TRINITY_DN482_c1_g3_i1.p1 TRINITY_DN482_c1_g3~~TRINITY_DN482_c1_g3_i1.p1  ORF type:complete len:138 (+),score=27.62 TRINITY_DN482_c1_g3_i1:253-666(+)